MLKKQKNKKKKIKKNLKLFSKNIIQINNKIPFYHKTQKKLKKEIIFIWSYQR